MPEGKEVLEKFYWNIHKAILSKQDARTGLLATGEEEDKAISVRDNLYSILCVWGLSIAYKKLDTNDMGRKYELEQSVVKCMRGLLYCMMGQTSKVENFKATQSHKDSLHARYNRTNGETIVSDDGWSHLQLDATSLFVLSLAQMTAGGLNIVFTQDEVDFVQNLVYYIETTYHTPDFGIWERGDKLNHGYPELNATSIGMAKAAMEAIDGVNLFGVTGGPTSVVHAFDDAIARHRFTLYSLLPRESASKEVDGALLSVVGYPAFAVEDINLITRTKEGVVEKLEGKYGCKRFLRDGFSTALEDKSRLYYEASELDNFKDIECEWPLFFTYSYIDALFAHDEQKAAEYSKKIQGTLVQQDGFSYIPILYSLPADKVEAEKKTPKSQERVPINSISMWAMSLWYLGQMIEQGLIEGNDIDPRGRHLCIGRDKAPVVQIALLSETDSLRRTLESLGITSQTPEQILPIEVRRSAELNAVYSLKGKNEKLKLSGRPPRAIGTLLSSRFYKIQGRTSVIIPHFMSQKDFYTSFDPMLLVDNIRAHVVYVHRYWRASLRPTVALMLNEQMFATQASSDAILSLLQDLVGGDIGGVAVKVARVQELLLTGTVSRQDFLVRPFKFGGSPLHGMASARPAFLAGIGRNRPRETPPTPTLSLNPTAQMINAEEQADNREICLASKKLTSSEKLELVSLSQEELCKRFQETDNLYLGVEILAILAQKNNNNLDCVLTFDENAEQGKARLGDLVEELYVKAGSLGLWGAVRYAAVIYGKYPYALGTAVTDILMYGKEVTLGKGAKVKIISTKLPDDVIHRLSMEYSDDPRTGLLVQEIIYYLGLFVRLNPPLFDGFLRIRVNYIVMVLTSEMERRAHNRITNDQAFDDLMDLSPVQLKGMVSWLLEMDDYKLHTTDFEEQSKEMVMQVDSEDLGKNIELPFSPKSEADKWVHRRMNEGSLSRVPKNFYNKIYTILTHTRGVQIGTKVLLSSVTAGMTSGEKNFALQVENMMDIVKRPGIRQLSVEVLCTISDYLESKGIFVDAVIYVNEILEAVMDSVLPSIYTEKIGEMELFNFLDTTGNDPESTQHDPYNHQYSLDAVSVDVASQNLEKMKERMRKRIYSTPPLECGFYAVRAFIDYYLSAHHTHV